MTTLIHDNARQFTSIDYNWHDVKGLKEFYMRKALLLLERSKRSRAWEDCTIIATEVVLEKPPNWEKATGRVACLENAAIMEEQF